MKTCQCETSAYLDECSFFPWPNELLTRVFIKAFDPFTENKSDNTSIYHHRMPTNTKVRSTFSVVKIKKQLENQKLYTFDLVFMMR